MKYVKHLSPKVQVFICTRNKENGESCGPKGGQELRDRLKKWTKNEGLSHDVKITASMCLSQCEAGIACCIHPNNKWFIKIDKDRDYDELKEEILKALKENS